MQYLKTEGLNVTWWGLQNEPGNWPNSTKSCPPASSVHRTFLQRSRLSSRLSRSARAAAGVDLGGNSYSTCSYTQCEYYHTFKACAKRIRALDPGIRIHANSWSGQVSAAPIALDPETLPLVDAWTWHTVNAASSRTFGNGTKYWAYGKVDFTNEMEYQPGSPFAGTEVGTAAAVNTFLNTLTFKDSPTGVIILHAIKPTTNLESLG